VDLTTAFLFDLRHELGQSVRCLFGGFQKTLRNRKLLRFAIPIGGQFYGIVAEPVKLDLPLADPFRSY
jgi:hypothetical protein